MKTIEITTTQNVTIEYELAALRDRALAWIIDAFVVMVGSLVLIQLIQAITRGTVFEDSGWIRLLVVTPFMLYFLYNIGFETWNNGQTPGKKALAIKVVRLDGKDPEWSDLLLRSVLHLVDSMFSGGAVGAILIKTTPRSQRLGDMAAHTTVIKVFNASHLYRLSSILNLSTRANYEPQFPQVRELSEQDMLMINRVIKRYQEYPNQAHLEVVEDLVTHLMPILKIERRPDNRMTFLKTLIQDYIVLTR